MGNVSFEIIDELNETRSNRFAFKLKITNDSIQRIDIESITPKVPEGIQVVQEPDTFQEASQARHDDLCEKLTSILDTYRLTQEDEYRQNIAVAIANLTNEIIKNVQSFFLRNYLFLFKAVLKPSEKNEFDSRTKDMNYKISCLEDANWAFETWISKSNNKNLIDIFKGNIKQLEREDAILDKTIAKYVAQVEPSSFYSRNYVIKAKRKWSKQSLNNISFDVLYRAANEEKKELRGSVSKTFVVAPYPFLLSLFSMIFGLVGATLQHSIDYSSMNDVHFFDSLQNYLLEGAGIKAIIIALVLFNIYENTQFNQRLRLGINWRAALIVGITSGLFGDRVIDALKLLLGID